MKLTNTELGFALDKAAAEALDRTDVTQVAKLGQQMARLIKGHTNAEVVVTLGAVLASLDNQDEDTLLSSLKLLSAAAYDALAVYDALDQGGDACETCDDKGCPKSPQHSEADADAPAATCSTIH